ncbi:hypothetical protein [Hungatella sp.]|jgi:hypothetical protein|uniref:hypothetical protein n=1 Tax=Hungatella sp. TaxID=2613924 RepID=UPI002A819AB6|nr:hypothetical protein [Hungatella sp.]
MITIQLYWNNICILHRQELAFLEQMKADLKKKDIDLSVTCFGLGYGRHLSDYLREPDSTLPDMVVSADLEVFEDSRIFGRFRESLHPLARRLPVKQEEGVPLLLRGDFLLPYLAIPLVFYGTGESIPENGSLSLDELVSERFPLTFGGIHNSAAKTVVKTVWETGGADAAKRLLSASSLTGMPIEAYQRVRNGMNSLALVPSVYALRADGNQSKAAWPADGAVVVPSYLCAADTIPEEAAIAVAEALRSPLISRFYVENGCLISCTPGSPEAPWPEGQKGDIRLPSAEFLDKLEPEEFYAVYDSCRREI